MKLEAYYELCKYKTCTCGAPLGDQKIGMFPHADGWKVDGIEELQWLGICCPECPAVWSLWELGVVDGRGK